MALANTSPYAADEISLGDAVELLRKTRLPISKDELARQCRKRGVTLVRRGRPNYASWTDLLKVHAAWVESSGNLP
jgi:hypothetical protein